MRVKNIVISIKSDEELFQEVKKVWDKIEKGEKVKKHQPSSIYELAKILKRDIKNTFDDVKFLAEAGLIELKKVQEGREKTTPSVNYDKILLEIPV